MFTNNNNNIKVDRKINLYSYFNDYGFKKFESIVKQERSYFLESLNYK